LLVFAAAFTTACDDDPAAPAEEEPEVETMRIVVGNQTINVTTAGVTGGPLVLQVGANNVSVQFLKANGQQDEIAHGGGFRLEVEPQGGAPVTFTLSATNSFAGTLNATATATGAVLRFSLFHIEEGHEDFGPFSVTTNITN
jgi:hypothetical protein